MTGQSILVRCLSSVTENQIDGIFNGWKGDTKYRLTNGQKWQQFEYKYAYRPKNTICNIME